MNITAKQASVLRVFEGNDELTIRQIANKSGRSVNSTQTMVSGLLARGYLIKGEGTRQEKTNISAHTYKKKNNIDDELKVFKSDEKQFNFVPYKTNQVPIAHQVPQKARTIHKLPDDKNGEHEGVYLAQSQHARQNRKHHTEVMRNNSTLNRI